MQANDILFLIGAVCAAVLLVIFMWQQRRKVVQWLVWAVSEAEKQLGEKTGQLKLHTVYAWFCGKFPKYAAVVPFSLFSAWVDVALKTMKQWIDNKTPIGAYITGKKDGEQ